MGCVGAGGAGGVVGVKNVKKWKIFKFLGVAFLLIWIDVWVFLVCLELRLGSFSASLGVVWAYFASQKALGRDLEVVI